MKCVLIVDKDRKAAEQLASLLRISEPALCCAMAETPESAALIAAELEVKLVLIGMAFDLDESTGSAQRIAASCNGRTPVLVTLAADPQGVQRALDEHVFDHVLCQPLRVAGLLGLIEAACAEHH